MAIPPTDGLPAELRAALTRAAEAWRDAESRPRPPAEVLQHWDALVNAWITDPSMPLLVRKSGDRGVENLHPTGRVVVCVDNSPAHWTYACALHGERPSLGELHAALESGEWPVVFAASKAEQAKMPRYRGLLARSRRAKALNERAWKVCHVDEVGLRGRGAVASFPLDRLTEACRRLLSPSNMFLVPNAHGGFGELPEVVATFRAARFGADRSS